MQPTHLHDNAGEHDVTALVNAMRNEGIFDNTQPTVVGSLPLPAAIAAKAPPTP